MGILQNSVSICQFDVVGELPTGDLPAWVGEQLAANPFHPIDRGSEELSVGWVHLHEVDAFDFPGVHVFQFDHYLAFTLRRDQRKLPAALFKAYREKAEAEFLAANPGLQRVPKQKREELKDAVRGALLARTLPVPAMFDAVWDTRNRRVSFCNLGGKTVDLFIDQFKKSFPPLRLVPLHPFARATEVIAPSLRSALQSANRATSDGVLELIGANQWLGQEFLLWLTHATITAPGDYAVCRPGPAVEGERFVAYLNDRFLLATVNENGVQKVTVSGPQDRFQEVRSALRSGKGIQEAVVYLEKEDQLWKLKLKGETFQFASFRSPGVTIEKDELTDPDMERLAVFLERMYLLGLGLQLFDSLFATFLGERLGPGWGDRQREISAWLEESTEPASIL